MAWSASKVFTTFLTDMINNTTAVTIASDVVNAALFDNTITPSNTVASAASAYGAGVWASGGQSSTTDWPAVGRPLASKTSTFATTTYTLDAADTASATSGATLSGSYGCLVYDDTIASPVADQGICFNYFGGVAAVTAGSFTIVWSASGIFTIAT